MGGGERAMSTPHLLLIEDNRDAVVATARLLTTYGFEWRSRATLKTESRRPSGSILT
jgi:hypothetical protein